MISALTVVTKITLLSEEVMALGSRICRRWFGSCSVTTAAGFCSVFTASDLALLIYHKQSYMHNVSEDKRQISARQHSPPPQPSLFLGLDRVTTR